MNQMTMTDANADAAVLKQEAKTWAEECGLKGPFMIDGPNMEKYPKFGHGYVLVIQETTGKKRMATARYSQDGNRKYWSVDGLVTG